MINNAQLLQLLPILFLFTTLIILIITISFYRKHFIVFIITIIGLFFSLISSLWLKHLLIYPLIIIDKYSLFYTFLLLISALSCSVFSYTYLNKNEEMYMLLICSTIGAILLVFSIHMSTLFLGLELMSISLYGLILFLRKHNHHELKLKALESGIKYMVLSSIASCFLLFGMALLYFYYGNLTFTNYYFKIDDNTAFWTILGIVLILISLGFKISVVPFHTYTPDLYEGTIPPITAFIATVTKISVFVAFIRLLMILPKLNDFLNNVITIISIFTIIVGNVLALKQNTLKRMLGFSSIANFGYLLTLIITMQMHPCKFILETINIYLFTYTLTNLGIFGVLSLINQDNLSDYKGFFWIKPDLTLILTIMLLSLAGIPITAGFIGKFYIFLNAINNQLWFILIFICLGNFLGIVYYLRFISFLYMTINKHVKNNFFISYNNSFVYYFVLFFFIIILLIGILPQVFISLIRIFS